MGSLLWVLAAAEFVRNDSFDLLQEEVRHD
jgi:hypothetical protein